MRRDSVEGERLGRRARRVAEQVSAALETVDARNVDLIFTLALLVFVGTLTYLSFGYRFESRVVPQVIGIPTFLMLLMLVAIQVGERIGLFDVDDVLAGSVLSFEVEFTESAPEAFEAAADRGTDVSGRSIVAILGWLALLLLVPFLIGIKYGILLFLVGAYRFYANETWIRTGVIAIVIWGFIIVIFEVILNIRL